jgi:hypothetical protein
LVEVQVKPFDEKLEWFQATCAKLCVEWNEGLMHINVRREFLLGDSVDAVMSLSRKDLRKLWRFEIIGEVKESTKVDWPANGLSWCVEIFLILTWGCGNTVKRIK